MGIKVCKFGGTSMADGNVILTAAKIVQADKERKYVVVSAPGKRFGADIKVTDLLYQCSDEFERGDTVAFAETFAKIRARFTNIETEIGKQLGMKEALDEVEKEILGGAGRDYCASRGEYLAAKIMSAVLGVAFVDATEFVRFNEDGTLSDTTFDLAAQVLSAHERAVIPGFYGLGANGKVSNSLGDKYNKIGKLSIYSTSDGGVAFYAREEES